MRIQIYIILIITTNQCEDDNGLYIYIIIPIGNYLAVYMLYTYNSFLSRKRVASLVKLVYETNAINEHTIIIYVQ